YLIVYFWFSLLTSPGFLIEKIEKLGKNKLLATTSKVSDRPAGYVDNAAMKYALSFGSELKKWRAARRMSQLSLSLEAEISQRHIAFLELGRAQPSRTMILKLAETLEVPLANRNELLQSAGFSALFSHTPLDDERLAQVRAALRFMLERHMPYPAVVIDRYWNFVAANQTAMALFGLPGDHKNLLHFYSNTPGLADQFLNWPEIAHHLLARLKREVGVSGGDDKLINLYTDTMESPVFQQAKSPAEPSHSFAALIRMMRDGAELSLFSSIAQMGTTSVISVSDLRIELFFPADTETDDFLQQFSD
ncbi:MAG: helix-turn-helix transcriptional regulator, partial [Kordiimonadaceae bacterium]|nr:helix-turn-helix transcriptional regulator [Kordiimonadaceae bacterium]